MVLAEIIVIILGLIILVIAVVAGVMLNKATKKIDVTPNSPLFENPSRTDFTDGYYAGVVKKIDVCKNKCFRVQFYPRDSEEGELGENKPAPLPQTVIVGRDYLKIFDQPKLSTRRTIIKAVPIDASDLPEGMIDTTEGHWMEKSSQEAFLKKTFGTYRKQGFQAIASMMDSTSELGVVNRWLANIRERNSEMTKMFTEMMLAKETTEEKKK